MEGAKDPTGGAKGPTGGAKGPNKGALTKERTTEQKRHLHILTVDINGLKANGKDLLKELKTLKDENREVDVVFITETHIGEKKKDRDALEKFEEDWKIFSTKYNSQSKGAAILVNKKRSFECLDVILDGFGRYVILNCWISGTSYSFVSVYRHSKERGLPKELSEKIKAVKTDFLVVGGNFNTPVNKEKDTSKYSPGHKKIKEELQSFMKDHQLRGASRKKHQDDENKDDEWLDYFFIYDYKLKLVQDYKINERKISDHQPVSLFLDLKDFQIFSSKAEDLPRVLAELCPDIILLAHGKANDKDYIKKLKEERKEKWNVLCSDNSNAAILVAEEQKDMHILFTVYHTTYVILHCIVSGRLHTFVSVCHPTEGDLQNMSQETMNQSRRIVIGGDFNTSDKFWKANDFIIPKGGNETLPYLIHDTLREACEIIRENLDALLILHLPRAEDPEDVDNITQLVYLLQI